MQCVDVVFVQKCVYFAPFRNWAAQRVNVVSAQKCVFFAPFRNWAAQCVNVLPVGAELAGGGASEEHGMED